MIVTAHDFVYSWRRVVDPATAAVYAYFFYYIENAETINAGKLRPEDLGVRALDDFTLQVDLRAPTPFFVQLVSFRVFSPVPRQAIEAAKRRGLESSWTEPSHMVSNGAFMLRQRRPRDEVVLTKNPTYYESDLVALNEIRFLSITDGTTMANLYKTGEAHVMPVSQLLLPMFELKRDFFTSPNFFHMCPFVNTRKAPLDNVLLRYALNMATDREQIARSFGGGRIPARSFIPPVEGYTGPQSLTINLDGKAFDVLSYNPASASELLARAGFPNGLGPDGHRLTIDYLFTELPSSQAIAEILQQQWRKNLGIELKLVRKEFRIWAQAMTTGDFSVGEGGGGGDYLDPNWFLELFLTRGPLGSIWNDPRYDTMLAKANAIADLGLRMRALADCETYLIRAMPFLPLFFDVQLYLKKPYVHGLESNPLNAHPFKYIYIDTNWKPEGEHEHLSRK